MNKKKQHEKKQNEELQVDVESKENIEETEQTTEQKSGLEIPEDNGNEQVEQDIPVSLEDKLAEMMALNGQLQDQYLRKAADFENYRKRMIKEKQEAIDYANTNLLADLIKILDDFDRAIGSVTSLEEQSSGIAFVEGITMIRNQLGSMLETKYGLQYYPAKGEVFDPNIHEAVASIPSTDVEEATVSEELLKGYKLKDRIVRLAQVAVLMPAQEGENGS